MTRTIRKRTKTKPDRRSRLGAILSMELMLVLPIVMALLFGMIEIGMLWSSGQRVKEAAAAGSRVAGFRGADELAVRRAVEHGLGRKSLVESYKLNVTKLIENPHEVCVTVTVPMSAAAPDMLKFIGFSLADRTLTAESIMRRE